MDGLVLLPDLPGVRSCVKLQISTAPDWLVRRLFSRHGTKHAPSTHWRDAKRRRGEKDIHVFPHIVSIGQSKNKTKLGATAHVTHSQCFRCFQPQASVVETTTFCRFVGNPKQTHPSTLPPTISFISTLSPQRTALFHPAGIWIALPTSTPPFLQPHLCPLSLHGAPCFLSLFREPVLHDRVLFSSHNNNFQRQS